ncbi:MAG TPA: hypothetical protein VE133_19035 [Candidatus Sulfotelmatobacter sp.]|jgi:hypothetical protein|nr:hypothetical protein [Candidatus Sulfotelmatobacter sp.]
MSGGFSNQPKILRGAFVEFGISIPPLIVVFQFNPLTISRTRAATPNAPRTPQASQGAQNLDFIQQIGASKGKSLVSFRNGQTITVQQEKMSFDVRLDASDKLNDGDTLTEQFGISPQLATLELMMLPKSQGLLGGAISALLGGKPKDFAFFDEARDPPIILFVWGRKKILPVNILNMQINEQEFSTDLNPLRAVVSVSLEVIEGPNLPFIYSKAMKEVMSLLNLANIGQLANTMVPQ